MKQAQEALEATRQGAQAAIDSIPPDAWPMIDIAFRITIAVTIVWLMLVIVAWWRRRAYNLTVASTARRNKKAQPEFLSVDEKARAKAIERGERHEDMLEDREREEEIAALKAAKGPLSLAARFASLTSLIMSLFTLASAMSGVVLGVGRMGDYLQEAGTSGRLEYLLREHTVGSIIVVLVIAIHIYQYFSKKKWEA
ncbi:hypothetical protein [Erythrobacter sp. JK5]|uniref:hypothetical protein n=1 Tax=Erythrobacter sp. JK5 TaxID=2829500 RepID=UPI001BA9416F|nr:hypothetical protein [Erythrobacter sp. JK5]QUL36754.1 hypothetical protein KDC96_10025 [Erythrobacter sp. JK5]